MRQRAVVLETEGKTATVAVSRSSMCAGCEKSAGCGGHCEIHGLIDLGDHKMTARAKNPIGAVPGDTVEIETKSGTVLSYAALVFILPLAVASLFFWLGSLLFTAEAAPYAAAAAGFALTFVFVALFDRSRRKKGPDITIVGKPDLTGPAEGEADGEGPENGAT
jgi:sigma-E factor negative regulatory protein RseC